MRRFTDSKDWIRKMNMYAASVQVVIDPQKTRVTLVQSESPDIYWIRIVGIGDHGGSALSIAIQGNSKEKAEYLSTAFKNVLQDDDRK
jgi:hypothetical protein